MLFYRTQMNIGELAEWIKMSGRHFYPTAREEDELVRPEANSLEIRSSYGELAEWSKAAVY